MTDSEQERCDYLCECWLLILILNNLINEGSWSL